MRSINNILLIPALIFFAQMVTAQVNQINIPLGGNCFITSSQRTNDSISDAGIVRWKDNSTVFSIYFRNEQKCMVQFGFKEESHSKSVIDITAEKSQEKFHFKGAESPVFTDEYVTLDMGYHCLQLKGRKKSDEQFAIISNLVLKTTAPDSIFHFVRENSGNRFYWGRRGPSLHLSYETPKDKNIDWFYSELTVPKDGDAIGSYFMANGFKEGYFGMQVNSETERRILFSVWSPSKTDDPLAIPADEKIILLKKGDDVKTGEFGNEGAGGQSYLIYPWIAGNTYRFLTNANPDGKGNTIYTSYFYVPEEKKWKLIASFLRPKTNTRLTNLHSFIENFVDTNGFLSRRCNFGNQWVLDTEDNWYELTTAFFTGDDIANVGYRMDLRGGVEKDHFFLQNGGFINDYVPLKQYFKRSPNIGHPEIDFSRLP